MARDRQRRRFIGVRERLEMQRQQHDASTKADPWPLRKLTIAIAAGVFGYSVYVVVVRLCVFALTDDPTRKLATGSAAAVLVLECILMLMFIWSYLRIILTSPGYARDHVPQSAAPAIEQETKELETTSRPSDTVAGPPYVASHRSSSHDLAPASPSAPHSSTVDLTDAEAVAEQNPQAGAVPAPLAGMLASAAAPAPADPAPKPMAETEAPVVLQRHPPPVALKEERWRYCAKCSIIKPVRTHHCRHCGTCVLAMDHHCPWIGLCVGARNRKYCELNPRTSRSWSTNGSLFAVFNFVSWAAIYTTFVSVVLIVNLALPPLSAGKDAVDAQQIVMTALAVLFAMFTWGMTLTQLWLIMHNTTTIESMGVTRMRERERAAIDRAYGFCNLAAKRRTLRRWNDEWGDPVREGNPFWLGWRRNWTAVMGERKLAWFLPVSAGREAEDGLDYPFNPRYTSDGRWQRREQWPEQYR